MFLRKLGEKKYLMKDMSTSIPFPMATILTYIHTSRKGYLTVSNNGGKIPLRWDVQEPHLKTFGRALQISDTFFPVGMYNFSHSLESFVEMEIVKDVDEFFLLLNDFNEMVRAGVSPGNYAIVLGLGGYLLGISCPEAMMIELYSFCISFVGAAMRLIKMDHYRAIKIISELQPLFTDIIKKNIYKEPEEMYSCAPLADIMSIKHEKAAVRIFLS